MRETKIDISSEPDNCKKEYIEDVCGTCSFKEMEMVAHPGGDSRYLVESYRCGWGYWEDDF
jgi:hypothetical protein